MTNSRAKGKAGELEFARLCRSMGYEVRRDGSLPIVAHRRNHTRWKITMDAADWFELFREWEAGIKID